MVKTARWELRFGLAVFACCAVWTVAARGREEAAATAPAANLVGRAESGQDSVTQELAKHNLPTDIPLPERTRYDGDVKKRGEYLDGYRAGFVDGVVGSITHRLAPSDAWLDGERAGNTAGRELWGKRADAERERRYGFSGYRAIGEKSPVAERLLFESFKEFRSRLLVSVKEQFPRSLQMADRESDYWSVIPYSYDDHSTSNSGVPIRRQAVKAVCAFTLSVAIGVVEDAEAAALKGEYILCFDQKDGQWIWDRDSDFGFHMQTEGPDQTRTGFFVTYHGGGGPSVVDRVEKVIAAATRPAVEGR